MRNSARCLLVCSVLLLTGMRDPFRPPGDPCAIGELAQWRFRGMVEGQETIGILQDGEMRWHRLKMHERFPAGWRITAVNAAELAVDVGDTCDPGKWTWQREGTDKNEFTDNAVLLAFSQPLWAAAPKPVTLVVDDVPVVQVLQALVAQENRNLVVSPDVSGTLSLNLTRVPWRQALRTVVTSAGLVLREEGGIFYVHTAAWQREQRERSEQEQARRQLDAPRRSLNGHSPFPYADAGELQKAAEKLLSPKGSLSVDTRTNRLLIRDNQAAVDTLQRWAAEMDIPVEQVELAAQYCDHHEKKPARVRG